MIGLTSRTPTGSPSTLADGDELRREYVVGSDGAHSAVRRMIGIEFVGKQYETHILLADVRMTNPPEEGLFARNKLGRHRAVGAVRRRVVPGHRLGSVA